MTAMSQGNKKITTRKIPATNNKVLVHTGSLCFSQEIPATNYEILVGTGTGTRETVHSKKVWYQILENKSMCPQ